MEEKMMEKIRKLLRLAESANEHESALALARAQEIALRNHIELSACRQEEKPADPVGRAFNEYQSHSRARKYVSWIIIYHFRVKLIWDGRKVWFIGAKSDVDFARYAYDFLLGEFPRLFLVAARRERWPADASRRASYYYGLYTGLSNKLREAAKADQHKIVSEVSQARGMEYATLAHNYALAVVDNTKAVERAVKVFFPHTRTSSSRSSYRHGDAISSGRSDGSRINISRPLGGTTSRHALA